MTGRDPIPFFVRCGLAALALVWFVTSRVVGDDAPINVLLITSDDLGLHLGCYEDPVARTPNLDALAAQSTVFRNAYVAQASCSPSRSAMFTGTYPHTNGQYALVNSGYSLHPRFRDQTIPNLLKPAGYRTGIAGKLHVAPEPSFEFDQRIRVNTRDVAKTADAAAEFIDQSGDQPFFLMVNYSDPHWDRENGKGPWFYRDQVAGVPAKVMTAGDVQPFAFQGYRSEEHLDRVAGYYNAVHRLDAAIGLLLEQLQESGKADNTLVLFVSDHGAPFARGKTTCYEAGLRVPFMIRWPGLTKPRTSLALVSTIDLLPTIMDAAGVAIPDHVQGVSLRLLTEGDESAARRYLVGEFHSHGLMPFYPRRAIRDSRYKLIHNLLPGRDVQARMDGDPSISESRDRDAIPAVFEAGYQRFADAPEYELFDLAADPWELNNLAGDPALADVQQRLTGALRQWQDETEDPLRDPEVIQRFIRNAEARKIVQPPVQ
ncbi:sulfatase family protein [Crateriforma spongiae]|uniref:sulfatase family protein n=1 Tax=Crateriforma spongiae TaxID=2724528 RepID=UPI001444AC44|nr:sulfatase [Crateriforma spongiae]